MASPSATCASTTGPRPTASAVAGSGSPHLHVVSSEAYVVLAGTGAVHTLGPAGFAVHPLRPGSIVSFGPGVVHRAVNDGDLEVLVLMSNAGLPEAGDAVLTFPAAVLADPAAYREAATLPGRRRVRRRDRRRRPPPPRPGARGLRRAAAPPSTASAPPPSRRSTTPPTRLVRPFAPRWQERGRAPSTPRTRARRPRSTACSAASRPHLARGTVVRRRRRPGAAAVRDVRPAPDLADVELIACRVGGPSRG